METDSHQVHQYILAKRRVEKISKFYKHLAIYMMVNIFLSAIIIVGDMNDGATFTEAFLKFKTFAVWIYWGIGIAIQAIETFGSRLFFNKKWEDKKVQQYIEEQKNKR